jgi:hypothetical protein
MSLEHPGPGLDVEMIAGHEQEFLANYDVGMVYRAKIGQR